MDRSIKSKLLKKYEAGQQVCHTQGESPAMDFYSPFGPMIAKVQSPPALLDRINAYADSRISGDEGRELIVPRELCSEGGESSLATHTADIIKRYLAGMETRW